MTQTEDKELAKLVRSLGLQHAGPADERAEHVYNGIATYKSLLTTEEGSNRKIRKLALHKMHKELVEQSNSK